MRFFLMILVVLVAISRRAAAECPVQSPFAVSGAGGTVQCVEFEFVGGMWQIALSVTGNPDATVTLRAIAGSQAVRYIRVEALRGPGFSTGTVALSVLETAPGRIQRLDEVSYFPSSDANLAISQVNISGSLGRPGVPGSAVIVADYVNAVDVFGDMCADVYAGPPFLSTTGISSVATVRSRSGWILGSIYVPASSLNMLDAPSGSIGAPNAVASVWAKAAIQRVSARAIWADIDSTFGSTPSDSSEVWRIATTAGALTGSLTARNIDGALPTSDGIFVSGGDLNADITILNEVRNPIQVSGSLAAGRTMYVGANLTGSGTAMNLGSLAGTLVFGGNIDKPITVTGPMTGIIAAAVP
ncbi:MAG: hypothetical protein DYG92_05070 [Leptolyngbya sp. PLA1]|nr:hypothetical protein [Leptolyngbya sp. PLA1]